MKCIDVYNHALSLISECPLSTSTLHEDYRERTQFLIASWCNEFQKADKNYRKSVGEGPGTIFSPILMLLEESFPLSERFAPAAAYFIASMLIAEENPEFSDKLYAKYSDAISSIMQEIPSSVEPVIDRYGFWEY